jgi:hypothetical protein
VQGEETSTIGALDSKSKSDYVSTPRGNRPQEAEMARKEVERTVMSEAQAEQFLKSYIKGHGWTPKEAAKRIRRCAATRWAALERWEPKPVARKGRVKKAA